MRLRSWALVFVAVTLHAQSTKPAAFCDRACLEGFVNQYLDAMMARNPYGLPLAPKIKFTENEQTIPLGEGIWGTASAPGTYKLYVADPQAGEVGFLGTLRENGTPVAFALRLKIEHRLISEVETMVVRDPGAGQAVEAMGQPDPLFVTPLAAGERRSRAELIAIANKYYEGIEHSKGDLVPFDPQCNRVQNGTRTTNNPELKLDPKDSWTPLSLGCKDQLDTKFFSFVRKVDPRRFTVVDEERGLVFGTFSVPYSRHRHHGGDSRRTGLLRSRCLIRRPPRSTSPSCTKSERQDPPSGGAANRCALRHGEPVL